MDNSGAFGCLFFGFETAGAAIGAARLDSIGKKGDGARRSARRNMRDDADTMHAIL